MKTTKIESGSSLAQREARLLSVLRALPANEGTIQAAVSKVSELSGLSVMDTVLGLVQLGFLGHVKCVIAARQNENSIFVVQQHTQTRKLLAKIIQPPAKQIRTSNQDANVTYVRNVNAHKINKRNAMRNANEERSDVCSDSENDSRPENKPVIQEEKTEEEVVQDVQDKEKDQEGLAKFMARELGEEDKAEMYLAYLNKYPRQTVMRAFQQAQDMPAYKIRKTRGALFIFLIQKYSE